MNAFRLVELLTKVVTLFVGVALMGGGAFLANRSTKSAAFAALAGFSVVASDFVRSWSFMMAIRFGFAPAYSHQLVSLVEVVTVPGFLILAIRSLPARAS